MVILCAVCCCINYADRVNMSVAIINIAEQYSFNLHEQSLIMSYFYLGYLPMNLGGALLCRRFGAKNVLTIGATLWSFFTVVTPIACLMGFKVLVVCRFLMGLSEGVAYPSVYHFLSTWISPTERARGVALLLSGTHVGTTLALILSPIIIREASWQAIFYSFGTLGMVWVAVWQMIAYDRYEKVQASAPPGEESSSSSSSNQDGTEQKEYLSSSSQEVRLVLAILRDRRTLAVCLTQAMFGLVHFVILSWLPSYFKNVYEIQTTSLSFTFIPYFSMAVSGNVGGYLADALLQGGMSLTRVRKVVTFAANLGAATMLLAFATAKTVGVALAYISLSLAFMSLNSGGFASCYMDMAAPSVVGIFKATSNTLASLGGFIALPLSTKIMDMLGGSWRAMFASLSICYLCMNVIFCSFVECERVLDESSGLPSKSALVS
ncbi:Major Facilitator [Gracilaria domingensis]|nr:Major Facilitator [Gracilaria domingensis]